MYSSLQAKIIYKCVIVEYTHNTVKYQSWYKSSNLFSLFIVGIFDSVRQNSDFQKFKKCLQLLKSKE